MNFFKSKTNIIFLFVIFMLAAALAAVSYFAYYKHMAYVEVSNNLTANTASLAQAQKKIDEYTAKIAEYDSQTIQDVKEKAELNSQLQAALEEKAALEKENSDLKNQLQELAVRKRRDELQQQIALRNINQADVAEGGVCYLTFDDGPSENTLRVLDILDAYGIKATFFVMGTGNTSYMPQITSRGHAIGLHTTTHIYESIYADVNSYLADIKQISDIVFNATGVRSNIMRFPGGGSNKISKDYCEGLMTDLTVRMQSLGYSYFDWNVDSGDASGHNVPAATIASNVLNRAQGKDSICVLMHDTNAKSTTVEALPTIIEGLDAMGYRFATLTAESFGFHQALRN